MKSVLLSYLKRCKQMIIDGLPPGCKCHVVLGNESCDLDSAVSAVCYSFYRDQKSSTHGAETQSYFVPMLNVKRTDFALRTDSIYAFKAFNIKADDLIFRDDFILLSVKDKLNLTLVDHNVLASPDVDLEDKVIEVIDHHVLTRPQQSGCVVELEMVGSCCTLIADKILRDATFSPPREILHLLYETILVDTVCLSDVAKRKTDKDEKIVGELEKCLGSVDRQKVFDEIIVAKSDVSGLNIDELLRKDLKVVRSTNFSVAISSIPVHITDFLKKPALFDSLTHFSSSQGVEAVVVMTLVIEADGSPKREIAVHSCQQSLRDQLCTILTESRSPDLKLGEMDSSFKIRAFSQGDVTASRKKVLPLVEENMKTLQIGN